MFPLAAAVTSLFVIVNASHAGPFSGIAPVDASGTIASTGVYQTVMNNDPNRQGCSIQNKATANAMTIRVGGATVWSLPAGQTFYCHWQGTVVISKIEITGTATDAFAASYQ